MKEKSLWPRPKRSMSHRHVGPFSGAMVGWIIQCCSCCDHGNCDACKAFTAVYYLYGITGTISFTIFMHVQCISILSLSFMLCSLPTSCWCSLPETLLFPVIHTYSCIVFPRGRENTGFVLLVLLTVLIWMNSLTESQTFKHLIPCWWCHPGRLAGGRMSLGTGSEVSEPCFLLVVEGMSSQLDAPVIICNCCSISPLWWWWTSVLLEEEAPNKPSLL